MRSSCYFALSTIMMMCLAGCSSTEKSRALAADLKESLGHYRNDRDQAIQKVNASYRTTYVLLMKQYRITKDELLSANRRAEARTAADEMLVDWQKRSTLTAVLTSLEATRTREIKVIDARAAAIQDVRKRYADAYAALDLELDKIKTAQSKVANLAEKDSARASTVTLLSKLAKAYQEAQKHESEKKQ